MTSIGETLRRERLKRNLDLEQISSELKISSRMLEAIEGEQFDKLPGGVFAKSFVRQYARLLGLDEEELVAQLQRALEPSPEESQSGHMPNPDVSAIHVPKVEEWRAVGQDRLQLSGSLPAAVLVVIVMLVCSGVYAWLQRPQAPVSAQVSPVENAGPPAQSTPQPTPAVATPVAPADPAPPQAAPPALPDAAPPQAAGPGAPNPGASNPGASNRPVETSPPPPVAALPAAAVAPQSLAPEKKAAASKRGTGVRVEVTAGETVWILAHTDGKFAFSGTLEAQQSRTVEAANEVILRFGNAGGVTLQLNGKPVGPAGPKGQVRTLQFTSGGFHIVPARPPAVPFDPLDRL
jgi:cytoskeleton protein RodZ